MRLSNMVSFFQKALQLGGDPKMHSIELKKIKFFNFFCYCWYVIALFCIIYVVQFSSQSYEDKLIFSIIHLTYIIIILAIQIIHSFSFLDTARVLFMFTLISIVFISTNIHPKKQIYEFDYLFIPLSVLLFIDQKRVNYFIISLTFMCYLLPHFYNDGIDFLKLYKGLFFVVFFIVVNYFKNINLQSQKVMKETNQELDDLNRFQSQFFINISHELRTPITLLKGHIDALKTFDDAEIQYIEKGMDRQVQKITTMINDVLDLAKMESKNFNLRSKPINISQLLERISLNFAPLFKQKEIRFTIQQHKKTYRTMGDPMLLERAFNNIIINAIKYTDKGGEISIKIQQKAGNLNIFIKDTGIGISKKDQEKIFNKFYQADNDINSAGGSGVGLAFCNQIIELHKGKITVKSTLGQGARFKISLPAIEHLEPIDSLEETITTTGQSLFKQNENEIIKGVFLLVDDHKEMRDYLKQLLHPCFCLEAENGIEALEMLEKESVDCIITDYMMPKMDGLEFIQTLKKKQIHIPTMMLTARGSTKSKLEVLRLGIDDYLQKPFEKEELLIRIKNILANQKSKLNYIKNTKTTAPESENITNWLLLIKNYVYQECSTPHFNQESIVNHFHISKSSFYRKIKSETGLTPNEFITEIKLQKARNIIENDTEVSVKKLALEVGFSHTSYFSKLFYKRFGCQPHQMGNAE